MTTSTKPEPFFLYGTAWKEEETAPLTRLAIESGFRGIDTANQRKHYFEAAVGEAISKAISDGLVTRDELFLQTKFTYLAGQDHRLPYDKEASFSTQVEQSFASSLEHLQTDYIDSYVLHGPSTRVGLTDADWEVWAKIEELKTSGKTRAIGVSNISAEQLHLLIDNAAIPPAFVQNRCYARTGWDQYVRQLCDEHDIVYQGFSLLTANVGALQSKLLSSLAEKYDRTIPQIVFRFALDIGMLPITGTTDQNHMQQDLRVFDFELTNEEVRAIEAVEG